MDDDPYDQQYILGYERQSHQPRPSNTVRLTARGSKSPNRFHPTKKIFSSSNKKLSTEEMLEMDTYATPQGENKKFQFASPPPRKTYDQGGVRSSYNSENRDSYVPPYANFASKAGRDIEMTTSQPYQPPEREKKSAFAQPQNQESYYRNSYNPNDREDSWINGNEGKSFKDTLLIKGRELVDLFMKLEDTLKMCQGKEQEFMEKKKKAKQLVKTCEEDISLFQETDEISAAETGLETVDAYENAIRKYEQIIIIGKDYANIFDKAESNSQLTDPEGIRKIKVSSEVMRIGDKALRERKHVQEKLNNFDKFQSENDDQNMIIENTAEQLIYQIKPSFQVYQECFERAQKMMISLSFTFLHEAKEVKDEVSICRIKLNKLKDCQFHIEQAFKSLSKLKELNQEISKRTLDLHKLLRTPMNMSSHLEIVKDSEHRQKIINIKAYLTFKKVEIKSWKYNIKNSVDPVAFDNHYFQVLRFSLKDELSNELKIIEHTHQFNLELCELIEKIIAEEMRFLRNVGSLDFQNPSDKDPDDGILNKEYHPEKHVLADVEELLKSNTIPKENMAQLTALTGRRLNVILTRHFRTRTNLLRMRGGQDIEEVLGDVVGYFLEVVDIHIKECLKSTESLNIRRSLQGNDVTEKIKELRIENYERTYKTLISDLYSNQNYINMDERTQKMIIANKSACRGKLTALEDLTNAQVPNEDTFKINEMKEMLRNADKGLTLLDDCSNINLKIKSMLNYIFNNPDDLCSDDNSHIIGNLKDDQNYISRAVENDFQKGIQEFSSTQPAIATILRYYSPQFESVCDVYKHYIRFFHKELPQLVTEGSQTLSKGLDNFISQVEHDAKDIVDQSKRRAILDCLPYWKKVILSNIGAANEKKLDEFKEDYTKLLAEIIRSGELYDTNKYSSIASRIEKAKAARGIVNNLILEVALENFVKLNVNGLCELVDLGSTSTEFQNVANIITSGDISDICKTILNVMNKQDFTADIKADPSYQKWQTEFQQMVTSVFNVFKKYGSRLIEFRQKLVDNEFMNFIDFFTDLLQNYDDLNSTLTKKNPDYPNLVKFAPLNDMLQFDKIYKQNYKLEDGQLLEHEKLIRAFADLLKLLQDLTNDFDVSKYEIDAVDEALKKYEKELANTFQTLSTMGSRSKTIQSLSSKSQKELANIQKLMGQIRDIYRQPDNQKTRDVVTNDASQMFTDSLSELSAKFALFAQRLAKDHKSMTTSQNQQMQSQQTMQNSQPAMQNSQPANNMASSQNKPSQFQQSSQDPDPEKKMNKTMSHSNSTLGKRNPNLPSGISDFTPARPNETNDINRPVGGMEPTRIPY